MVELTRPVVPADVEHLLGPRAGIFAEVGVPATFALGSLEADAELSRVPTAGGPVVAFARCGPLSRLVVRPEDGAVSADDVENGDMADETGGPTR